MARTPIEDIVDILTSSSRLGEDLKEELVWIRDTMEPSELKDFDVAAVVIKVVTRSWAWMGLSLRMRICRALALGNDELQYECACRQHKIENELARLDRDVIDEYFKIRIETDTLDNLGNRDLGYVPHLREFPQFAHACGD